MSVAPAALPRRAGATSLLDGGAVALAGLAAAVVTAGLALGWRGVDLPAQLYRVELFRRHGFTLWDSQWFGGHWLLDYSVLFPAIAAAVGVGAVTVASAALATVAFDRLIVAHFGATARAASVAFALGVTVQSSIGQLTFLLGEAAGLWCLVLVCRRRWSAACLIGAGAALTSPLAGAFVALALGTVALAHAGHPRRLRWPPRGLCLVIAAVGVPVAGMALLFPGDGPMPYPIEDFVWELVVAAGMAALTSRRDRVLRTGTALYALTALASVAVPSPLGGNVGRLEDCVALPVAVALLWPRRRILLAVVGVPLVASQWSPAWAAMTTNASQPWTHRAFYRPVTAWLHGHDDGAGRVEVVPTLDHWEAAYVAPAVALARGWERQLDLADNPLFYQPGVLSASSYRAWLVDNGVRYVALPDVPLDAAGVAEGRLVAAGVPGVRQVWRHGGWRVFTVDGSSGIVGAGGSLVRIDGSALSVRVARAGPVLVRVRFSPAWRVVSGAATVSEAPGGWLELTAATPGVVTLGVHVLG